MNATATGTIWLTINAPAGLKRKQLADNLAHHLQVEVAYQGTPSFAYQVGAIWLDKAWNIPLTATQAADLIPVITTAAEELGATVTILDNAKALLEADAESATGGERDELGLVIAFPTTGWTERTRNNLEALIASKGKLIARALNVPLVSVEFEDDKALFPWFDAQPEDAVREAAIRLIDAMIERATNATRISTRAPKPGNDKYTMRCFLLSLGFIGTDHKQLRATLLANCQAPGFVEADFSVS